MREARRLLESVFGFWERSARPCTRHVHGREHEVASWDGLTISLARSRLPTEASFVGCPSRLRQRGHSAVTERPRLTAYEPRAVVAILHQLATNAGLAVRQ